MSELVWMWVVFLGILVPTAYAAYFGAPYVPSRKKAVQHVFEELDINENDVVIDLGAGDGLVVEEAAKRKATAIGYELSPIMWLIGKIRVWKQPHANIRLKNFYTAPVKDATILFAFLMPRTMPRLKAFLAQSEIPKGKYLISYGWVFEDEIPVHVVREPKCLPMYVYDLQSLTKH